MALDWKAWAALTVFVFQNAAMALLMRWNKSAAPPYSNSVAVLMQEFAVKLPVSFLLYSYDTGGRPLSSLRADLKMRPDEWLKLGIPALLYTVQNIMLYVGYANLEAAVGMVTYQTKIIFTALCSVLLLGKELSQNQWLAVAMLAVGIVCVQGFFNTKPITAPPPPPPPGPDRVAVTHGSKGRHSGSHGHGHMLLEMADDTQAASFPLGVFAMLVASACTSFASVYFEKMLKGASKPNLWLRNIQLASYSSVIALVTLCIGEQPSNGWFYNFGFNAWLSVWTNALGGLLVAVTIKYADNILRGFAQALAIIMGAIGSHIVFGTTFGTSFANGVVLVIASVFLYGETTKTPSGLIYKLQTKLCSGKKRAQPYEAL